MLIDDDEERASWVQSCLEELGFAVSGKVQDPMRVLKAISDQKPDIIVIDMQSPGRDILESLAIVAEHQPTPVVMFSEEQDPDYINRAVESGVSTYLVGSIDPVKVRPVIQVAMAQFKAFQRVKSELHSTQGKLQQRQAVDGAKRYLMRRYQLSEDDAYAQMRAFAMRERCAIHEVAQNILDQQPMDTST